MPVTVKQALSIGGLKQCKVLAGKGGLNRHILHVDSMEIPNIGSWLAPGELLVTTGYAIQNADTELVNLIQDLHAANAAGLAIKTRFIGSVPGNAIQAAEHLNIPLLEVPSDMAFVEITTPLVKAVVDEQNSRLEFSEAIHRKFIELELNQGGFDGIADMLRSLLCVPVVITDRMFQILALKTAADFEEGEKRLTECCELCAGDDSAINFHQNMSLHIPDLDKGSFEYIFRRIHIKSRVQGYLILYTSADSLPDMFDVILDHAVTTIALEFSKRKALKEQAIFMGNHFFLDILSGNVKNEEECRERASRLHWPNPPFRLLVFDINSCPQLNGDKDEADVQEIKEQVCSIIMAYLQNTISRAAVVMKSDSFTCLIPDSAAGTRESIIKVVHKISQAVSKEVNITFTAGVSSRCQSFHDLTDAYGESRDAIMIALSDHDLKPLVFIEDARLEQAFMKTADNPYIQKYVRKVITTLIEYDMKNGSNLFETLNVFIDCMGIKTKTAEALYLHRNSLAHRIKKIEEITSYDLSRTSDLLSLGFAMKMYPYISTAPTDSFGDAK